MREYIVRYEEIHKYLKELTTKYFSSLNDEQIEKKTQ